MKRFENRQNLADALAETVAQALSRVVTVKGHAVLAVSGGTTPQLFFENLAWQEITWDKVTVTLVDERHVEETSPRSNARLVKANLLQAHAAAARFVPLYQNVKEASQLDLDVVVLGMGTDGHTASFFPGGDRLKDALDPENREGVVAMNAPGAGEPRITFTLPKLVSAERVFLHIEGAEKINVLEAAKAGDDVGAMPIRAVLRQPKKIEIYWCP